MEISSSGIGQAINAGLDTIEQRTKDIQSQMAEIRNMESADQNRAMMEM